MKSETFSFFRTHAIIYRLQIRQEFQKKGSNFLKFKSPEKNSTQVCRIMVVLEFVIFFFLRFRTYCEVMILAREASRPSRGFANSDLSSKADNFSFLIFSLTRLEAKI